MLHDHLSYTPGINNPVGIILSKESEFYLQHDDYRIESYQTTVPGQIKNSLLLPEEDVRFYKNGWAFPNLSPFVPGCIKIESMN